MGDYPEPSICGNNCLKTNSYGKERVAPPSVSSCNAGDYGLYSGMEFRTDRIEVA